MARDQDQSLLHPPWALAGSQGEAAWDASSCEVDAAACQASSKLRAARLSFWQGIASDLHCSFSEVAGKGPKPLSFLEEQQARTHLFNASLMLATTMVRKLA